MPAKRKRDARRAKRKFYDKFVPRVEAAKLKRIERQYDNAKPDSKTRETSRDMWVKAQMSKTRKRK